MSEPNLIEEIEWGVKRGFDGFVLGPWPRKYAESVVASERDDPCHLVSRRVLRSEWEAS